MAYLGNTPLLSTMRTVTEGTAYANQTEIPVPGGFVHPLVDVVINGAELGSEDYDSTSGASIKLYVPMPVGSFYRVKAWTPNQTVVNAGGQLAGFRNKIINGNFDIWQRGTSLAAAASSRFLADRFISESIGSTIAPSRQAFTLGQTDVPGEPVYFHRCVVSSVANANNYSRLLQQIEGVRTLAGQTATLSFWAKADAAKNISTEFSQIMGSGGSPSAAVVSLGITICALTTTWKKFTVTVSLPSLNGKTLGSNLNDNLQVCFWLEAGSTYASRCPLGQQSGTFDIAQIQFEHGGVATQFEQRPIGLELALCQRYWEQSYEDGIPAGTATSIGAMFRSLETTFGWAKIGDAVFKVRKRAIPTMVIYSSQTGAAGKIYLTGNGDYDGGPVNPSTWGSCIRVNGSAVSADAYVQWIANAEL